MISSLTLPEISKHRQAQMGPQGEEQARDKRKRASQRLEELPNGAMWVVQEKNKPKMGPWQEARLRWPPVQCCEAGGQTMPEVTPARCHNTLLLRGP